MWPLFNIFTAVAAETPAPLMLPDSVQKARFAETVRRLCPVNCPRRIATIAAACLSVRLNASIEAV